MSIKKYFTSVGKKLSLFKNKHSKTTLNIQTTQNIIQTQEQQEINQHLLDNSIKNITSTTYKNEIKTMFEDRLKQNVTHFNKAATSYFANLVLFNAIQTDTGDTLSPKALSLFGTLEDIFPFIALVDTPKDTDDVLHEFGSMNKITLEGVMRWFSDSYVRGQFEYMLLEENKGVALIDLALLEDDVRLKQVRGLAVKKLAESLGEIYFISLRATLLNTLRDKAPADLFKAGEFEAKVMTNSHNKHIEEMDLENKELLASISRVNSLWLRVVTNYELMYREKFPKGRVNEEFYDSKLVNVLLNLKKEGVKEENIHELSLLDNKLDLTVRRKITSFGFVRGY